MMQPLRRLFLIFLGLLPAPLVADDPPSPKEQGLPVINWSEAPKHVGKAVVVQGEIVATHNIGSICFLNFDRARTFTAIVKKANFSRFPVAPEDAYKNKRVRIRGTISEFKGKPQIEITSPDQVTIVGSAPQATTPVPGLPDSSPRRVFDGTIRVAAYNVRNLFDEHDDPYTADEGTPAKPHAELEALARSIRELDADVLALEEVENRGFLEQFSRTMLTGLGYEEVVCPDSNDHRGIDLAVLSRLPIGAVSTYQHQAFQDAAGAPMTFRRGFLQVEILPPDCKPFSVFVVHFKSKLGDAAESNRIREGEAAAARRILDAQLSRDRDAHFVICGDFNDEWNSPTMRTIVGSGSGKLGDFLKDLPSEPTSYNPHPGSMIDFILSSPALHHSYVPKSYRIIPGSVEASGSDHNPVTVEFRLR